VAVDRGMEVGDVHVTCTDTLIIFDSEINFWIILSLTYLLQKVSDNLVEILLDFYLLVREVIHVRIFSRCLESWGAEA
jgi:hypothetical protein